MNTVPHSVQVLSTVFFFVGIMHTFLVGKFANLSHKYSGTMKGNFFHFLSEVEVVFGFWSGLFIFVFGVFYGFRHYDPHTGELIGGAFHYIESLNFHEPLFVAVIMAMASTRPIILFVQKLLLMLANVLPFQEKMGFYLSALILGPILGSFITEPAAMTVTSLVLVNILFKNVDQSVHKDNSPMVGLHRQFRYGTLALLMVNISIGGTLTHFAAPPVVMVAKTWNWNFPFMFMNFGIKSIIAVTLSTALYALYFRKILHGSLDLEELDTDEKLKPRLWKVGVHLAFLCLAVLLSHYPKLLIGIFIFFLGFINITEKYQTPLKLKESLLVGFFLSGLIVLGSLQSYWLTPLISTMSSITLFLGAIGLTAITDNAAITYLGTLVQLSDVAKYLLVAGAVTGGGLTVIANAPNPIAFGMFKKFFPEGLSHGKVFLWAILPTSIAAILFLF